MGRLPDIPCIKKNIGHTWWAVNIFFLSMPETHAVMEQTEASMELVNREMNGMLGDDYFDRTGRGKYTDP